MISTGPMTYYVPSYSGFFPHLLWVALWLAAIPALAQDTSSSEQELSPLQQRGQTIYANQCADCHGARGEGVSDAYEDALVGDDSIGQLSELIVETMPEGSPEECMGADAEAVAAYIHYAFYSEAAQIRNRPPKIRLARLTANQLRQSVADLFARFEGLPDLSTERGLQGRYYNGDRRRDSNKKVERIDPVLDFDFGRESPGEGIEAEAFYIEWNGGILADQTGRYEIIVRSSCSFVFYLGDDDREFINNHVQSGDKTEFRRSIQLTAGRVYPLKIEFRQRKRKTELPPARISLSWTAPGGMERVIPERNLIPNRVPATYSLQAILPPDDRSYGYERGIAINREWDSSTTEAALEFAQIASEELWPAYQRRNRSSKLEGRAKLKAFLADVLETAFRSPLSDELKSRFIDKQLEAEADDSEAIKRVLLVSLKSPRFLYPTADLVASPSERAANRLALVLFDSLPTDESLRRLARDGKLQTREQIRNYAERSVSDFRVQAKTREFLHAWLNLEQFEEITKAEEYAGFDRELVDDLRLSLDAFMDRIVWSEASDYRQLFLAKESITTPRIAEFYGEAWQPAEESASGIALTVSSDDHLGLLTHPYLLSSLAYHDSTSPIHRGVFLIRYMLGRTIRPPADAFTPLSPDLHPMLTTRERVDLQTSPDSCQVCHSKINGLGFTLEHYDAVGKFRDTDNQKPINAQGSYTTRQGERVNFNDARELATFLAHNDDAHRAFVARAFQHFVKQPPAAYGADTLDRLTEQFRTQDFNIRKLVVDIAVTASAQTLPQ